MKSKEILTHLLTLCFVLLAFAYSYIFFSHNGLPIGWDTPRYVWQIAYAADNPLGFVAENEGYNVFYPVFGCFFVRIGVTPMNIEMILPPILTFILILEIVRNLSLLTTGEDLHIRILTALSWFAVFRVGADLHANLLALIFSFQALYSLSKYYENKKTRPLTTALISFFLSSFTHIETTLFFTVVVTIGSILSQDLKKATKTIILIVLTITPGLALYYHHISLIASYSGGVIAGNVRMHLGTWFTYLSPLGLFGLPGLYFAVSEFRRKKSFLLAAPFVWGLASIAIGLLQYVHPSLIIFGERAVMLYPGPLLAQFVIFKVHLSQFFQKYCKRIEALALVVMAVVSFSYTSNLTYRVFLPSSAYQKILWIKENYGDKNLILVVDDYDEYAGIAGDLYDNWVKAIVGIKSYIYLGNLYYLYQKVPTPYFNPVSTQISNKFFNTINERIDDLSNVIIIYMNDLNNPSLPPKYYLAVMENVYNGVYTVNITKVSCINDIIKVPLHRAKVIQGNFYTIQRNWTESGYALELWESKIIESNPSCQLKFAIKNKGVYRVIIRYWDADKGTSLGMKIDNEYAYTLDYSGLAEPNVATIFEGFLNSGEHVLTVEIRGQPLYASLDYVEIRLVAINETGY